MPPSRRCSSRAALIAIEGMPGAGKTSVVSLLARRSLRILGEYVDHPDSPPAVDDDGAHQRNWLRKAQLAGCLVAGGETVYCDRDFLTSLAYAHSVAQMDGRLLPERTSWALGHLGAGRLRVADVYLVLDITASVSLARRSTRLCVEHPWSRVDVLERLRAFYLAPAAVLGEASRELAAAFARSRWHLRSGDTALADVVAFAEGLARG